jgi:hypothetical protein
MARAIAAEAFRRSGRAGPKCGQLIKRIGEEMIASLRYDRQAGGRSGLCARPGVIYLDRKRHRPTFS